MSSDNEIESLFESINLSEILEPLQVLTECNICPHKCKVNKFFSHSGYCCGDTSFNIATICKHMGEEPAISGENGICNIFFSGCNLQCVYCQNFQISSNRIDRLEYSRDIKEVIASILRLLDEACHAVGFVSPSHNIPQMKVIITLLKLLGRNPVFVMNTNAYDTVESIRELENLIDVYLPDFKYMDDELAKVLSGVPAYPEFAGDSIKEMYRQKSDSLKLNEKGEAVSGLIIRHLVLPGYIENSLAVLRYIASELSPKVHVSLMSQYYPIGNNHRLPDLNRKLRSVEYDRVTDEMHKLGFENGWVQDLDSPDNYNPDFRKEHPFE